MPPKEPRIQYDIKNKNLELPFDAPEPCTTYDYGTPHYSNDNHVKHLHFDDNNVDNMTDEAKHLYFHQDYNIKR